MAGCARAVDKEAEEGADLWTQLPVRCPADLPATVVRRLERWTLRACDVLGVRHMARLDFRWDGAAPPQLIDVNPIPTLRPGGSFYAVAAAAAGLDYAALWRELLAVATASARG
jgi:D-alanine-D-alanine ligase